MITLKVLYKNIIRQAAITFNRHLGGERYLPGVKESFKGVKAVIKKKICMLGGYSVGKTSLVQNFVHSIFSEKYHITLGVKIDKKKILVNDQEVTLMLWDIAGEEENFTIPLSYLKGSDGYILVIDGTRRRTYEQAMDIQNRVQEAAGDIPFVVALNKADLITEWEVAPPDLDEMEQRNWTVIQSSAKSGKGVEEAFNELSKKIFDRS